MNKYIEKNAGITIASGMFTPGGRIHDFFKGWGTVAENGHDIIWDWWKPLSEEQQAELQKRRDNNDLYSKFIVPDFTKDVESLSKYNFDIRDIMLTNKIADS